MAGVTGCVRSRHRLQAIGIKTLTECRSLALAQPSQELPGAPLTNPLSMPAVAQGWAKARPSRLYARAAEPPDGGLTVLSLPLPGSPHHRLERVRRWPAPPAADRRAAWWCRAAGSSGAPAGRRSRAQACWSRAGARPCSGRATPSARATARPPAISSSSANPPSSLRFCRVDRRPVSRRRARANARASTLIQAHRR